MLDVSLPEKEAIKSETTDMEASKYRRGEESIINWDIENYLKETIDPRPNSVFDNKNDQHHRYS